MIKYSIHEDKRRLASGSAPSIPDVGETILIEAAMYRVTGRSWVQWQDPDLLIGPGLYATLNVVEVEQ